MPELTRETVMRQLYITEEDINLIPDKVLEKLYIATILNQEIGIATKTLNEIHKLKDLIFGEKK